METLDSNSRNGPPARFQVRSRVWRWCVGVLSALLGTLHPFSAILHVPSPDDGPRFVGEGDRKLDSITEAFRQVRSGDEIRLYRGTYAITPGYPASCCGDSPAPLQLVGKSNIVVRAFSSGAEIRGEGPGEFLYLNGSADIRFEGIAFRGNKPDVVFDSLYSMVLLRDWNRNLRFENCRFTGFGNHAISQLFGAKASTGIVVRGCSFSNGGASNDGPPFNSWHADGAAVSGVGSNWVIENNLVEDCMLGFEVEGQYGISTNVLIRNNVIRRPGYIGIAVFATSGKSSDFADITIAGNVIADARSNPPQLGGGVGILVGGGERIAISGNTVENGGNTAIWVAGNWSPLRDCTISRNTVKNAGIHGIQVFAFPSFPTSGVTIRGNTVVAAARNGIHAGGVGIAIADNTLLDNGWLGVFAGIQVAETVSGTGDVLIAENRIGNEATQDQDYGIVVGGQVSGIRIGRNEFQGNKLGPILAHGPISTWGRCFKPAAPGQNVTFEFFGPPDSTAAVEISRDLTSWQPSGVVSFDASGIAEQLHFETVAAKDYLRLKSSD